MTDRIVRIPLTIVATGSGKETPGVLVGVMAAELDELEARAEAWRDRYVAAEAVIAQWYDGPCKPPLLVGGRRST